MCDIYNTRKQLNKWISISIMIQGNIWKNKKNYGTLDQLTSKISHLTLQDSVTCEIFFIVSDPKLFAEFEFSEKVKEKIFFSPTSQIKNTSKMTRESMLIEHDIDQNFSFFFLVCLLEIFPNIYDTIEFYTKKHFEKITWKFLHFRLFQTCVSLGS